MYKIPFVLLASLLSFVRVVVLVVLVLRTRYVVALGAG